MNLQKQKKGVTKDKKQKTKKTFSYDDPDHGIFNKNKN